MSKQFDGSEQEPFLKPISAGSPSGESVRYAAIYDEIREARRNEDIRLPQGVWRRDLKTADWPLADKLCIQVLTTQSKDLQVAAWLAEAWLHQKGIRGLCQGVELMHSLCDKFWDSMHPLIDEDGADYRLAPIDWLNEKLPEQIGMYAISNPEQDSLSYYSLAEFDYVQNMGNKAQADKNSAGQKEMTQSALQKSIKGTADYFYQMLYEDCLQTITALEDFEKFLSEKLPDYEVSLYQLRMSLGKFRDCMLSVLKERDLLSSVPKTLVLDTIVEPEKPPMNDQEQLPPAPATMQLSINSQLATREQAYAMLAEIARYLEAIEPHSPTPYLLKKAITWGNMPLSSLLQEFIQNNMDFAQLQRWLGIPNPAQTAEAAKAVAQKS